MRRDLSEGIPWSTAAVLPETFRRAAGAGLEAACLAPWFDVDTADDLARLRTEVAAAGERAPAHTRRFLAALSTGGPASGPNHGDLAARRRRGPL
ncbi:MAG: hypothetical protein ACREM3_20685 [Candidatus Rokuibacteriota bacterium]